MNLKRKYIATPNFVVKKDGQAGFTKMPWYHSDKIAYLNPQAQTIRREY